MHQSTPTQRAQPGLVTLTGSTGDNTAYATRAFTTYTWEALLSFECKIICIRQRLLRLALGKKVLNCQCKALKILCVILFLSRTPF